MRFADMLTYLGVVLCSHQYRCGTRTWSHAQICWLGISSVGDGAYPMCVYVCLPVRHARLFSDSNTKGVLWMSVEPATGVVLAMLVFGDCRTPTSIARQLDFCLRWGVKVVVGRCLARRCRVCRLHSHIRNACHYIYDVVPGMAHTVRVMCAHWRMFLPGWVWHARSFDRSAGCFVSTIMCQTLL